jgi:hypothetical protein
MSTIDFDEHLSAVLDEATVGAEEGDEDYQDIKAILEALIFDD